MCVISEHQYPSLTSSHNQHVYIFPQKRCESVGQCVCHILLSLILTLTFIANTFGRKCRPSSTWIIFSTIWVIQSDTYTLTMICVCVVHCHTWPISALQARFLRILSFAIHSINCRIKPMNVSRKGQPAVAQNTQKDLNSGVKSIQLKNYINVCRRNNLQQHNIPKWCTLM